MESILVLDAGGFSDILHPRTKRGTCLDVLDGIWRHHVIEPTGGCCRYWPSTAAHSNLCLHFNFLDLRRDFQGLEEMGDVFDPQRHAELAEARGRDRRGIPVATNS